MPYSGGTFTIVNTFVSGTTILASKVNENYADIATNGLSFAMIKNGTQTITANIPMAGHVFTGLGTFTEAINVSLSTASAITGTETSTDAGAANGPIHILDRNSATPTANDVIGALRYNGRDSAGNSTTYVQAFATIKDATNGSEDGLWTVQTIVAGSPQSVLNAAAGVYASGQTDPGIGNIAAATFYQSGTALTSAADASFSANKGSTDQSISATTLTTVDFGTEVFDTGTHFATNAWTPPAGTAQVGTQVTVLNASGGIAVVTLYLAIDGTITYATRASVDDNHYATLPITQLVQASGANAYTVRIYSDAAITVVAQDVLNSKPCSLFWGSMI